MTPREVASFLATAARAAPSADNSQPLDFFWNGQQFCVAFSRVRGNGKLFGRDSHPTLLTVGACIENVEAALASLHLKGEWQLNVEQAGESNYARLTIVGACNSTQPPATLPLFNRHTNRFPYKNTPLPTGVLQMVAGLTQGSARVIVLSGSSNKDALVACAQRAAEARFCTRELHEWLMGSLRFTPSQINGGEGLDAHTLDLPPGGSLFMRFIADWKRMSLLNRFGTYKALAAIDTRLLNAAPALVCIIGTMKPLGVVAAGRLLASLWNKLNAEGIATQPYYVITDQLLRLQADVVPPGMVERVCRIREALPNLLGLRQDESLHMVLRIGQPKIDPPRSRRLPLSTVYKDLTEA